MVEAGTLSTMSTLADSDEHDAPPRRAAEPVPQAEVSTQSASQTPDADTSVPDSPADAFTQQRIGALVLQRLFDRKPTAMRIGRFSVLERIGRGGMGTVYAAYDEQLDRKVAVKVLGRSDRGGDVARRRLQREAQAMARLSHPNVVTVHEVGESDGEVFVAMEFIRGQSLDAWIKTSPDWREVVEVFVQAGRGLIAAHEAGLVHRDLKPHNIMRTDEGVVKVLDFGLARAAGDDSVDSLELPAVSSSSSGSVLDDELTRTGAVLGTPAYMSPEQIDGRSLDARSDLYAFAVVCFEAITGQRLVDSREFAGVAYEVTRRPAPSLLAFRPELPAAFDEAFRRALAKDPAERPDSVAAWVTSVLTTLADVSRDAPGWPAELTRSGPALSHAETVREAALDATRVSLFES